MLYHAGQPHDESRVAWLEASVLACGLEMTPACGPCGWPQTSTPVAACNRLRVHAQGAGMCSVGGAGAGSVAGAASSLPAGTLPQSVPAAAAAASAAAAAARSSCSPAAAAVSLSTHALALAA